MNVLLWLAAILLILMIAIGGKKGGRAFISLFLNLCAIILTILIMTIPDVNPIILTLVASIGICCINLFFTNEVNRKTVSAFISTMITLVILLFFIMIVTEKAMIQGFSQERMNEMAMFSLYIGVDFMKVGAAVIIMSTIGAITDVAISVSSPMHEISNHNAEMSRKDLFRSGLKIGRDILGTDTNTLFFAFFGNYLGLLLWFKDLSYSIGEIVNAKVFTSEMITILFAGIGVTLIIPITAWMNAYIFMKPKKKS